MIAAGDRVDSHQHYWEAKRSFPLGGSWLSGAVGYPWRQAGLAQLDQSFLPESLEPPARALGFGQTLTVQAINSSGETRWLLDLAEEHPSIAGVVGWIELRQSAEHVARDLARLRHPRLVGFRHLVQFEEDERWLLRPDVVAGLMVLARAGLTYDLLLSPAQLRTVPELSERLPELNLVIDHLAKPAIRSGLLEPWRSDLEAAAANPRVYCKLSGMVTEADWRRWTVKDLQPYVAAVIETFGPDRVLYGSDWPVCTLAGSLKRVFRASQQILTDILGSGECPELAGIYGGNARRFYGLRHGGAEAARGDGAR